LAKPDISILQSLERETTYSDGNFVISKAVNFDNRPEKAQANQHRKIIKTAINDRYVADNYY
jgi:hypothetical protein